MVKRSAASALSGTSAGKTLRNIVKGPIVGLLAIILFFAAVTPGFFSFGNFINIFNQIAIWGVLALGMTFVISTGGVDLSVGCVLGLASMVMGYAAEYLGLPFPLAMLLGTLVGPVAGLINGLLVSKVKLPPFIATLSMFYVARGLANIITDGDQILNYPAWFIGLNYTRYLGFITVSGIVFLLLVGSSQFFLTKTGAGRNLLAVGGSEEVARLSGINVDRHLILAYVISGTFAAIAGIMIASRVNASEPAQGTTYELYAIAIAVIGGTSLSGGEGSIIGTLIGAFIIGILNNGLNLNGISPFIQTILVGVIIVFAVGLDMFSRTRGGSRPQHAA